MTARWRERFNGFVKALKPSCVYSAGNVSPRREYLAPFDWRSGDFFSPGFFLLHDMARMMRWYGTLGIPYDAVHLPVPVLRMCGNTCAAAARTVERMQQEAATVAANGGTVGYWTFPLGDGALVPSRMEKAKAVRRFLQAREEQLLHTHSVQWTAIAVTDAATPTFGGANVEGAHKALAALHRSPELMDETGICAEMPYDLLVIPEQAVIDARTAAALAAYVEQGGKLLTSGTAIASPELRRLLGVASVRRGALQDGHVLLQTSDEPTGVASNWDQLELDGGEELYPLYLSWDQFNPESSTLAPNWPMHGQLDEAHPAPAGFPAAVTRAVGKGRLVHLCTDIFAQYGTLGDPQLLRWLREVIDYLQPAPFFTTDAPSWVDVSLRRKGEALLVHFVNGNPGRDVAKLGTDDLWVDELPTIGPITCRLRLPAPPARVTIEPEGGEADTQWQAGLLTAVLPHLHIHACLQLRLTPGSAVILTARG